MSTRASAVPRTTPVRFDQFRAPDVPDTVVTQVGPVDNASAGEILTMLRGWLPGRPATRRRPGVGYVLPERSWSGWRPCPARAGRLGGVPAARIRGQAVARHPGGRGLVRVSGVEPRPLQPAQERLARRVGRVVRAKPLVLGLLR